MRVNAATLPDRHTLGSAVQLADLTLSKLFFKLDPLKKQKQKQKFTHAALDKLDGTFVATLQPPSTCSGASKQLFERALACRPEARQTCQKVLRAVLNGPMHNVVVVSMGKMWWLIQRAWPFSMVRCTTFS